MRKLAFLIAVGAFMAPASASATLGRPNDRDVTGLTIAQRYLAADAAYWHVSPEQLAHINHCHDYTIEVGETTEEIRAESPEPGCWQRLSQSVWQEVEEGNLRLGCMVSEHEYGHSTGHPDEENDPSNIMFAEGPPITSVPGCMTFPIHGRFPRTRCHHASRSITVPSTVRRASFMVGQIPAKASVTTAIYVDDHAVYGTACGPLCELAGTEAIAVETLAKSHTAPLLVRVANYYGAHHVTVQLCWRRD